MWATPPSVALCTFLRCDAIAAERKVHRFVRRPKVKLLSESKPVTYVRKGPVYTCARSRLPEGSAMRTAPLRSALPSALCSALLGSALLRAFLVPNEPNQMRGGSSPCRVASGLYTYRAKRRARRARLMVVRAA